MARIGENEKLIAKGILYRYHSPAADKLPEHSGAATMTKSKKHGIGLCKEKIVVDPTRHTLNTVSVYVDDANHFTNVDGLVDSHKYHWAPPHSVNVISLTDPTGGSTVSAAVVQIQAYCIGRKSGGFGDGDDDLIVTVYYDDPSGTETDECTFTEVEYDTSALETKAKNDRPR